LEEESDDNLEPIIAPPAKARKFDKDGGTKSKEIPDNETDSDVSQNDDANDSSEYEPPEPPKPNTPKADTKSKTTSARRLQAVDFQQLANCVWDCKENIDPLMVSARGRTDLYVWTVLLDELKTLSYTTTRLNKGKDVPPEIVDLARPGQ
jgi:hypothetical protein